MTKGNGAKDAGVADPWFPTHGDLRWSAEHYDLALEYNVNTNRLDAAATVRVRALVATRELAFDLRDLTVRKVLVDGGAPDKVTHKGGRLRVRLSGVLEPDAVATVRIAYAGKPAPVPGLFGPAGWEELVDGALVAAQPYGAPSWFPCNDRASDKASYRIAATVPDGWTVTANGRLAGRSAKGGRTTWVHEQRQPTSPYLASLQVGRFVVDQVACLSEQVEIVRPRAVAAGAGTAFARQGEMLDFFTGVFGPYPFDVYRAVIAAEPLEIPLEAQSFSHFGTNHVPAVWENERLVAHELAHQWFGNAITARRWVDIWLHEGFACYAEWLWSERSGGWSTERRARHHHAKLAALPQDLVLADPGLADMFDDRVYKRGALTLHALRVELGDAAFFELVRTWVAEHVHGLVDTDDFRRLVARYGAAAERVLGEWLDNLPLPAIPG